MQQASSSHLLPIQLVYTTYPLEVVFSIATRANSRKYPNLWRYFCFVWGDLV